MIDALSFIRRAAGRPAPEMDWQCWHFMPTSLARIAGMIAPHDFDGFHSTVLRNTCCWHTRRYLNLSADGTLRRRPLSKRSTAGAYQRLSPLLASAIAQPVNAHQNRAFELIKIISARRRVNDGLICAIKAMIYCQLLVKVVSTDRFITLRFSIDRHWNMGFAQRPCLNMKWVLVWLIKLRKKINSAAWDCRQIWYQNSCLFRKGITDWPDAPLYAKISKRSLCQRRWIVMFYISDRLWNLKAGICRLWRDYTE